MPDHTQSSRESRPSAPDRLLDGLALLGDPVRRAIYEYVAAAHDDVSRDAVATAAGVTRAVASFHLDRLAEAGLVTASFRRLSGRSGPGAGRPSKLYRRSERQVDVSLPPRRYELAAELLAEAVDGVGGSGSREALANQARARGFTLGGAARAHVGRRRVSPRRLVAALKTLLVAQGYEPEQVGPELRLRNCPFHALAGAHRKLICGMNLALLEGVVAGLEITGVTPAMATRPDACCVCLQLDLGRGAERQTAEQEP